MNTPRKLMMLWTVVAHLILLSEAHPQTQSSWIGRRVITQYGAVLKVGKQVVDDAGRTASLTASGKDRSLFRVYRVEHTKGEWLWLQDEKSGAHGWVQVRYVIPYEQAIDYLTS